MQQICRMIAVFRAPHAVPASAGGVQSLRGARASEKYVASV